MFHGVDTAHEIDQVPLGAPGEGLEHVKHGRPAHQATARS
jgi:hypothetical protein